jgi:dienelactone hydrolase
MKKLSFIAMLILLAGSAQAAIKTQTIEYKHGDTVLEGYLAYDDAVQTRRPAVLVVHEWWGNNEYSRKRAEQLAALGYVGFAIDMYGKGVTTTDPTKAGELAGLYRTTPVGLERAMLGLETLKAQPMVDPQKIAAIGYCFGGTVSLQMARANLPILGVVSFHGALAPPPGAGAQKIAAKILVCHGSEDTFVPPADVNAFMDEMRKTSADWQLTYYSGAVHAFTNPNAGSFNIPGIAYNKAADERSWQAMQDFLKEVFK